MFFCYVGMLEFTQVVVRCFPCFSLSSLLFCRTATWNSAFCKQKFFFTIGSHNWGLICLNSSLRHKTSVGFFCCTVKLMLGADGWLKQAVTCGLGWFGMLQLSVCRCSSKEEHVEPSEEIASCHQCVFAKACSLLCFAWVGEIGWRICELMGGTSFYLVPMETCRRWGDHEGWVIPWLQTRGCFIPRQWSITIKLSRILL